MDSRWMGWFIGFFLTSGVVVAPVASADPAECKATGTVVESGVGRVVVKSQNERIQFSIPVDVRERAGTLEVGDRVTVIFDASSKQKPWVAREIIGKVSPQKQAPGQAPGVNEKPPVIDDRAFYPA